MTALAAARKLQTRKGDYATGPVAAGVVIYAGARVVIDNAGNLRPARASTTDRAYGYAEQTYDNSAGAAGAITAKVRFGVALFVNSANADLITYAAVGTQCYLVDDQTVALTSATNTRITGGIIVDVDADGVWVNCGPGR
jgi:hypothetical protein